MPVSDIATGMSAPGIRRRVLLIPRRRSGEKRRPTSREMLYCGLDVLAKSIVYLQLGFASYGCIIVVRHGLAQTARLAVVLEINVGFTLLGTKNSTFNILRVVLH